MNGELAPNKYDIIIATPEMEKILRPAAKVLRAMLPTTKRGLLCSRTTAMLPIAQSVVST
jgi:hypothetical protein